LFFKQIRWATFMNVRRWLFPQGAKQSFAPPRNCDEEPKVFKNLKSASWFQLFDLILAITLYLPIWHSHCTRASFAVLVWCSNALAVHSGPLLRLQTHVAQLASALVSCCPLLRNNNMATNIQGFNWSYDRWCIFSHVTVDLLHLWQAIQRNSDCW